jgi:hypothetical protein
MSILSHSLREITQGPVIQGAGETVPYKLTTTPWGSSPTNPSAAVTDVASGATVTSTVMPAGSATVVGDDVFLPLLTALTAGHTYKIAITFTINNAILVAYAYVVCES